MSDCEMSGLVEAGADARVCGDQRLLGGLHIRTAFQQITGQANRDCSRWWLLAGERVEENGAGIFSEQDFELILRGGDLQLQLGDRGLGIGEELQAEGRQR